MKYTIQRLFIRSDISKIIEQEKKEHIEKIRKHISELENDVKSNLW